MDRLQVSVTRNATLGAGSGSSTNIMRQEATSDATTRLVANRNGAPSRSVPTGLSRRIHPTAGYTIAYFVSRSFSHITTRAKIDELIKNILREPYTLWTEWPHSLKEELLVIYIDCFEFLPSSKKEVRSALFSFIKSRYPNWIYRARLKAMTKAKVLQFTQACKNYPPAWISSEVWACMIDIWLMVKTKNKSTPSKGNMTANIPHFVVSAPYDHHEAFEEKNGLTACALERLEETFMTNDEVGTEKLLDSDAEKLENEYRKVLEGVPMDISGSPSIVLGEQVSVEYFSSNYVERAVADRLIWEAVAKEREIQNQLIDQMNQLQSKINSLEQILLGDLHASMNYNSTPAMPLCSVTSSTLLPFGSSLIGGPTHFGPFGSMSFGAMTPSTSEQATNDGQHSSGFPFGLG